MQIIIEKSFLIIFYILFAHIIYNAYFWAILKNEKIMNTYETVTATIKSNIVTILADNDKIQVKLSSLVQHAKDAGMNIMDMPDVDGYVDQVELDAKTYVLCNLDDVATSYVEFNLMVA